MITSKYYRIFILIILGIMCYCIYENSNRNRYYMPPEKVFILDTKTGSIYTLDKDNKEWVKSASF